MVKVEGGRGRGGCDYMRGGRGARGRGRGGCTNHHSRCLNNYNPNNYPHQNNWNEPNFYNNHGDCSYSHNHDHSVAFSM